MAHEELWTQTGLLSVLVYLLDHDTVNQKMLMDQTNANNATIYKIKYILKDYDLIQVETGKRNNEYLYSLTEKGKRFAKLFKELDSML